MPPARERCLAVDRQSEPVEGPQWRCGDLSHTQLVHLQNSAALLARGSGHSRYTDMRDTTRHYSLLARISGTSLQPNHSAPASLPPPACDPSLRPLHEMHIVSPD